MTEPVSNAAVAPQAVVALYLEVLRLFFILRWHNNLETYRRFPLHVQLFGWLAYSRVQGWASYHAWGPVNPAILKVLGAKWPSWSMDSWGAGVSFMYKDLWMGLKILGKGVIAVPPPGKSYSTYVDSPGSVDVSDMELWTLLSDLMAQGGVLRKSKYWNALPAIADPVADVGKTKADGGRSVWFPGWGSYNKGNSA